MNGSPQVVLGWPTEREEVSGEWFTGPLVGYMRAKVHDVGYQPRNMGWHYVLPESCMGKDEVDAALLEHMGWLRARLKCLPAEHKVVIAVGELAARYFGVEGDLLKVRGSVFEWVDEGRKWWIIPTFDLGYLVAGNQREEPTFCSDIKKAFRISAEGWKPPQELFDMYLGFDELIARLEGIIERKAMIACDLETTSLNPRNAQILVLGIAEDGERAFSVPFLSKGRVPVWDGLQHKQLHEVLRRLFLTCGTLWQNAAYDVAVLKCKGFRFGQTIDDTMLMHHTYHVELPHGLGYLASVYADTPYWKDAVLKNVNDMSNIEDDVLRTYNLRDCVVLWPIYHALKDQLVQNDVWKIYTNIARRLIHPVTELELNGMRLVSSRLADWKEQLKEQVNLWGERFKVGALLPDWFNPQGKIHLQWLFLGMKPGTYGAKLKEWELYQGDTKKRKDTKKYKELDQFIRLFTEVKPFPRLKGAYLRTLSGGYDLGAQGLIKMRLMANKEIEDIEALKKENAEKAQRREELLAFVKVVGVFGELKKWSKLASTYGDFNVGGDGRIHPKYNIAGTRTGRLSSSGPNWQNLPPIVKKLFAPEKGWMFVEADFSNIEMRTLSYASDDTVLQEQFAQGKKIHKENTKVLFGLEKDEEPDNENSIYKKMYKCAKTYIFGRGYGGGLKGIYERVLLQVPGIDLKFTDFVKADEAYRREHPKYVEWAEKIVAESVANRCVSTAFGRKRWFLDDENKIKRECLNTPNQGTAADAFNLALIGVQAWIDTQEGVRLVGAVHDSIIVECRVERRDEVCRVMKQVMEQPYHLWGRTVSFPVEFKAGVTSWAELESIDVEATNGSDNRRSNIAASEDNGWFEEWGAFDE